MNGIIYARYSDASQREESIEGQIRECKEYAQRNGITILGVYIDRALSAKTDNRPDFQRMIKDSAKGLFEIVLVWKLDRFARNRYDSAHYKAILRKNGVKVVSARENISDGPEGIILESMLEGYAEYYPAELSEKIHRGQHENALKGRNNGGGIPLGYLLGAEQKLVVDPSTAPIVVEIFKRYAEGETIRSIIEDLNGRQLRSKRNKPFSIGSFNALLKNRKYIGEYQYQDVVIPGGVPAIVPEELFFRVQARMEKNKRAPARTKTEEDFLLTTKLFCGDCGRMMVGESGSSHTGKTHFYYKCGAAKRRKGCKKKAAKKDWIEEVVVRWTVNRVLRDEEIDRIADKLVLLQDKEDLLLPSLRQQLADTEKGLENLVDAIQQGLLTSTTKKRLDELEARKESLQVSILEAELQRPKYTKEQMVCYMRQFKYGDADSKDYRRRIIDTFVNSIYLFEDKIVFTYNYRDGTETISFAEIEAALGSDFVAVCPPQNENLVNWLI
ncbi:recombinase family protein [Anaerotruncus sp. AF02-27]|uniref:recombinase family protein n=1 Tax=Anaerotruncus sp. AF02-27 TaxID=2292191 RepID=UPI000E489952|nr:recombinase family protein [Anaerotruncus sp. AF02-27]RGX54684.1 recombinase family protein [Anaerotruncus sp. AF02-27]